MSETEGFSAHEIGVQVDLSESDNLQNELDVLGVNDNDIDFTSDHDDELPEDYQMESLTADQSILENSDQESENSNNLELTCTYEKGYVPFPSGYGAQQQPTIPRHPKTKKYHRYYTLQDKDNQFIIQSHIRDPNRTIGSIRYDLMHNLLKITNKRKWTPSRNFNNVIYQWEKGHGIRDRRKKQSTSGPNEATVLTPAFMKKLDELVEKYPSASQAVYSAHMEASVGSINAGIKKLRYKAYRLRKCTMLSEKHIRSRLKFCNSMRDKDAEFWKKVWFTDECYIMENKRMVNSKNVRFYARDITLVPRKFYEQASQSASGARVMIWAGFRHGRLVWHIYEKGTKIDSEIYMKMLEDTLFNGSFEKDDVFQQDGLRLHTSPEVIDYLATKTENIISQKSWFSSDLPEWPACSPDLTLADFALWPAMRRVIAKEMPVGRVALIACINKTLQGFADNPDFLNRAVESTPIRINECIQQNGGLFERYMKKSKKKS